MAAGTQWRTSLTGPIGLDYPAVFAVADRIEIEVDTSTFRKIRHLEILTLEGMREKNVERRKFCQACRAARKDKNCASCDKETIKLVKRGETNG